ncbi:hypothetical protein N8I77_011598 [Diaporthe amygdali]|uniref:NACHT domain-containing protein n=1 Tax=Phomopsis amygdali TaxID=1214568 RepID=A0AAD9S5R1_PHOAM|nr:hypothetical protein N8I77_011598 [Diaporthe amygdali]
MRNHVTLSLTKQDEILNQLTTMRKEMIGRRTRFAEARERGADDSPGNVIMDYLSGFLNPDVEHRAIDKLHEEIKHLISDTTEDFKDWDNVIGKNYPDFRLSPMKESSLQDQFIEDLRFREMDYRESVISEAYGDTFRWIFEDSDEKRTGFTDWLQSDANLYWIAGKAGSGKSTLMKFIDTYERNTEGQDSRCRRYLERWADGRKLFVASFYFWASGSPVEASQMGLLRTLIYQLLQQRPDIIPMITPRLWESACLFGFSKKKWSNTDWTVKNLRAMLASAVKTLATPGSSRVCLFVDGLDEFDGDPQTLLAQFKQLTELPNVKFNEGFERLQIREPTYASELMDKITDKASGSLLAGLTYDDRISDLQRRLDALPADLEKLYVAILDDLDPFYFEHASQYFKLLMIAPDPPSALVFSFADEEDPDFVLKQSVKPLTDDQVAMRITTTRRRLNSRCKGLIELGPENRVQFLHRSVRDYLHNQGIQHRLEEDIGDFDAHLRYCAAYFSVLKSKISENPQSSWVGHHVKLCLFAASEVSKSKSLMVRYLDALNQLLTDNLGPTKVKAVYQLVPDINGLNAWSQQPFGTNFLALTVRFSVTAYIAARAPAGCIAEQFDQNVTTKPQNGNNDESDSPSSPTHPHPRFKPFLSSSRRGNTRFGKLSGLLGWRSSNRKSQLAAKTWPLLLDANFGHPPRADVFKCLFEHGADCNVVYDGDEGGKRTPWTNILDATFVAAVFPETPDEWFGWMPTVRLFVENGAKVSRRTIYQAVERMPRIRVNTLNGGRAYSALQSVLDGNEELALQKLRGGSAD